MRLLNIIYQTIINSLFPVSKLDRDVLSLKPEQALAQLTKSSKPPLDKTRSIFAYKDPLVTKLIWNIKYKKSETALKIGAYALYLEIKKLYSSTDSGFTNNNTKIIIVPIPSSKRRLSERGFNQTELLADYIKALDTDGLIIIRKDILLRQHHQQRQTLKDREERLENAKGIFSIDEEVTIQLSQQDKDSLFIILDDVITTGSTISSAIDTLTVNGFKKVYGLSLAH